jgi:hypothetical protein
MGLTPCEELCRMWANTNKVRHKTLPLAKAVSCLVWSDLIWSRDSTKIKQNHRASNEAESDQEAQPKEKSNGSPSKAKVVMNEMNRDNAER